MLVEKAKTSSSTLSTASCAAGVNCTCAAIPSLDLYVDLLFCCQGGVGARLPASPRLSVFLFQPKFGICLAVPSGPPQEGVEEVIPLLLNFRHVAACTMCSYATYYVSYYLVFVNGIAVPCIRSMGGVYIRKH